MPKDKVYCINCRYLRVGRNKHYCHHPKWLIKETEEGNAIYPKHTKTKWSRRRENPMYINRFNQCHLYEKKRWWHVILDFEVPE